MVTLSEAEKKNKKKELELLIKQMNVEFGQPHNETTPEVVIHLGGSESHPEKKWGLWPDSREPQALIGPGGGIVGSNPEAFPFNQCSKYFDDPKIFINQSGIIEGADSKALKRFGTYFVGKHYLTLIHPMYGGLIEDIMKTDLKTITMPIELRRTPETKHYELAYAVFNSVTLTAHGIKGKLVFLPERAK